METTEPPGTEKATRKLIPHLLDLVEQAGAAILEVYDGRSASEMKVRLKADRSPVTSADMASHRILLAGLQRLTPEIPVVSEESSATPWEERKLWGSYWLIDPLDGTKEFLNKNGEFTVNVALIVEGKPYLGVVGVPVRGEFYVGGPDGAFFLSGRQAEALDLDSGVYCGTRPVRVAVSRSHPSEAVQQLLDQLDSPQCVALGSSLKLCLLARGDVDLYPRLGPIMEWDIAAAHAVVLAAGAILRAVDGTEVIYNSEDLYAPWFIAHRKGVVVPRMT